MAYFAGIDVSLELSSICIVDADGKIVREVKLASEPEALVEYLSKVGFGVSRVGLEAGPLSQWLHDGLGKRGSCSMSIQRFGDQMNGMSMSLAAALISSGLQSRSTSSAISRLASSRAARLAGLCLRLKSGHPRNCNEPT